MADQQNFHAAVAELRRLTKSAENRSLVSLLVRASAVSRPAARVLVNSELRSRADRKQAILDAAEAIRAAAAGKAAGE
jgi:hypothetical protein